MNFIIFPILLALMYVVLLRPQQRRVRQQQQLITSIDVGDEIVTGGGLIGRVVGLTDDRLQLEVADDVVVDILRLAISRRLEPSFDDESEDDGEMGAPTDSESDDDDDVVAVPAELHPAAPIVPDPPPATPTGTATPEITAPAEEPR